MTFKLNLMILGLCSVAGLAAADANLNPGTPKQTADQLLVEAKATRVASLDLVTQLKSRQANLAKVSEDVAAIEKSAGAVHTLVGHLDGHKSQLTAQQQTTLADVKQLTELLHIFLENKKSLVADGASPSERERIRANAMMVAARAERVEKLVRKMSM